MPPKPKISQEARNIRNIIISTPFLIASSYLLYKRLYLGEEQRRLPIPPADGSGVGMGAHSAALEAAGVKGEEWKGVPEGVRKRIQEAEAGQGRERERAGEKSDWK
ncbi:hypothetical protein JCM21900_005948 [Sporobolomyces salmonicolor]